MLSESIEKGEINKLVCIPGKTMVANCMTKKGASSRDLLDILRNGYLADPSLHAVDNDGQ